MKKFMFLLPVAALALASCSSDSVVEQPATKVVSAEALQIFPDIQGVTRVDRVYDNTNFDKFKLQTSGKFMKKNQLGADSAVINETVTKTSGKWSIAGLTDSDEGYYWPSKSSSSSFTAWAPVSDNVKEGAYTADTDIAKQEDIVVAFNKGTATEFESGVPLKFRHILSQIVVKADNADKNDVTIKVKSIRLTNIANTRSWSLPTSSTVSELPTVWSSEAASGEVNYVPTFSEITLDGSVKDITGANPLLLIPQTLGTATIGKGQGQYLSLLVQIVDASGNLIYPANNCKGDTNGDEPDPDYRSNGVDGTEKWAWAAVDINTTWEPGKKYIYTLHFTKNGYGKIDYITDGGNTKPGDDNNPDTKDDPEAGDDVTDAPVPLVLEVEVIDWVDATPAEEHNM